jgi:hypothetical protein
MKVKESQDYAIFRDTLGEELLGRQERLLRGPMWSGCCKEDIGNPLKVSNYVYETTVRCVAAGCIGCIADIYLFLDLLNVCFSIVKYHLLLCRIVSRT